MGFIACKGRDAWVCRVIDQVGDYKILKASRSYIVKNVIGDYSNKTKGIQRQLSGLKGISAFTYDDLMGI